MSQKIKFRNVQDANFTTTLNLRIQDYFKQNHITDKGNALMAFKVIFFLAGFVGSYLLIYLSGDNFIASLGSWLLLGLFTAFVGFNISHDAVHGSLSENKYINKILGYTFNLAGTNKYMWKLMHNVIHHTYTNIPGHDEDLEPVSFIRLSTENKLKKIHRFQHWYAYFFYCLTSISWVFKKDFSSFFRKKLGNYDNKKHPVKEYIILFISKAVYFALFLVLPIALIDLPWWMTTIGFVSMHFIQGITLAVVFQLAHVVEGATFPAPDEKGDIMNNWTIHQLNTTANFAMKSPLAAWFFGGLNFQVEHHLFPHICHIHYPQLAPIVKQTAKEFGISYHENTTMWDAIKSHTRMLKLLGRFDVLPSATATAA
ncbi:MAG: acyl-CoA desaturase [Bacteroidetes bacterium]|nr:acyl-CoA desaturase [Bacteroidota bacterium]